MLNEAKRSAKQYRKGTDVEIFGWNVDRFYDGMWDKIYSTLTSGTEDSVEMSKNSFNIYDFSDVAGAPAKWERPGFDSVCVYQANKEDLKFVEALAKKFHLDYEYKFDKNILKTPNAIVIYIPEGAHVDEYLQYEPDSYRTTFSKNKAKAATVTTDSVYDDDVDESLRFLAKI